MQIPRATTWSLGSRGGAEEIISGNAISISTTIGPNCIILEYKHKWSQGIAAGADVQPPFTLGYRRGPGDVRVGWAILKPQP